MQIRQTAIYIRLYHEVYTTLSDRMPFLSPEAVLSKLDACDLLKTGGIKGLVDYGSVDIAGLLRARKRIAIDVVVPSIPAIEAEAGELLQAYPTRLRIIPSEAVKVYRLINAPDQTFYEFALSVVKAKFRQDLYPRIKIGGLLINAHPSNTEKERTIEKEKWVIVTGCTRGATTYIWLVLGKAGLRPLGHDRYGRVGMVAGPGTLTIHPPGTVVIHQVRNPIKTIRSLLCTVKRLMKICTFSEPFFHWQWENKPLFFAMRYWYEWNKLGEERAVFTYRVEAIEDSWQEIKRLTGIPAGKGLKDFSHRSNTFRGVTYPDLTWDDLYAEDSELAQKIADLAVHFGYRTD